MSVQAVIALVAIVVTILLALGMWIVTGMTNWGRAAEQLANHTLLIQQIQQQMLKPSDLESAVLKMQIQLMDSLDKRFYTKLEGRNLERRIGDRKGEQERD